MADTPKNVCGILERLTEIGDEKDRASIGNIVEAFGSRSYGPVLLVPALIGISPVGGIPGVPTFLALTLLLIAVYGLVLLAVVLCGLLLARWISRPVEKLLEAGFRQDDDLWIYIPLVLHTDELAKGYEQGDLETALMPVSQIAEVIKSTLPQLEALIERDRNFE